MFTTLCYMSIQRIYTLILILLLLLYLLYELYYIFVNENENILFLQLLIYDKNYQQLFSISTNQILECGVIFYFPSVKNL